MKPFHLLGVRKRYGERTVLDVEDFSIERGRFFVLLGPSGSGKTTLVRVLAGLVRPDEGEVRIGGKAALDLPPHRRGIGVVFQGLALWPHLTVRANLALGL
ncbi:MAG: ATP-binding cassette domain-containing protein, partial [Planctomycetota bacterium]